MFDLFFMSYAEPEAEKNWLILKSQVPTAKRVHGVEGIARAWVEAAKRSTTSHFFTMDGDSRLNPNFSFQLEDFQGEKDKRVHVYRCKNAVNGLVYGYGSIHLFNTELVRNFRSLDVVDFTLSVATQGFKIQPEIASTTNFNTSEYISFKSGFREASKLASETNTYVGTQVDERTQKRLLIWTSLGSDVPYGDWVILGARVGAIFGKTNKDSKEKLALISNHKWFEEEFSKFAPGNLQSDLQKSKRELHEFNILCQDYTPQQSKMIKQILYKV